MLQTIDSYLATIPEAALIVMAMSLGWVIGTALLYAVISWFGW
jgi:hypothetical protein